MEVDEEEDVCCQLSTALHFLAKGAQRIDRDTFVRLAQQAAARHLKPAHETQEHAVPVPASGQAEPGPAGEAPAHFLHVRTAERQVQRQPAPQGAPAQDAAPGSAIEGELPPGTSSLAPTVPVGPLSCNGRQSVSSIKNPMQQQHHHHHHHQKEQCELPDAQEEHSELREGFSDRMEESSSLTSGSDEDEEDVFAPRYCFVQRGPEGCKVASNMPQILTDDLLDNEDLGAFLSTEADSIHEERRILMRHFKLLCNATPSFPKLVGMDLVRLQAEAEVEVMSDAEDFGSEHGLPQGSQGSLDLNAPSEGAVSEDADPEDSNEDEGASQQVEEDEEGEDILAHPLLARAAALDRARHKRARGKPDTQEDAPALDEHHRQAMAEALSGILVSCGIVPSTPAAEGGMQLDISELVATLSGNAQCDSLGMFGSRLESLRKSLLGASMVQLMEGIAEGLHGLIQDWQQHKLPAEEARASSIWYAARLPVRRGIIAQVVAAAGLAGDEEEEYTLLQAWKEELSHWRGRLLGEVEELIRTHRDGVEAFLRDRSKFCRNYLETTVFDIQDRQYKLQVAALPTCPEDKPLPEELVRQPRDPRLTEVELDEVNEVLRVAGRKKKSGGGGGVGGRQHCGDGIGQHHGVSRGAAAAGTVEGAGDQAARKQAKERMEVGEGEELGSEDSDSEEEESEGGEGEEEEEEEREEEDYEDDGWLVDDDPEAAGAAGKVSGATFSGRFAKDVEDEGEEGEEEGEGADEDERASSEAGEGAEGSEGRAAAAATPGAWNAAHLKKGTTQVLVAKPPTHRTSPGPPPSPLVPQAVEGMEGEGTPVPPGEANVQGDRENAAAAGADAQGRGEDVPPGEGGAQGGQEDAAAAAAAAVAAQQQQEQSNETKDETEVSEEDAGVEGPGVVGDGQAHQGLGDADADAEMVEAQQGQEGMVEEEDAGRSGASEMEEEGGEEQAADASAGGGDTTAGSEGEGAAAAVNGGKEGPEGQAAGQGHGNGHTANGAQEPGTEMGSSAGGASSGRGQGLLEQDKSSAPRTSPMQGQQQVKRGDLVHRRMPSRTEEASYGPYAVWLPGYVVRSLDAERCTLSAAETSCSLPESLDAIRPQFPDSGISHGWPVRAPKASLSDPEVAHARGEQLTMLDWDALEPGSVLEVLIEGEQVTLEPLVLLHKVSSRRSPYRYHFYPQTELPSEQPPMAAPGPRLKSCGSTSSSCSWLGFRLCHAPGQRLTHEHLMVVDKEEGGMGVSGARPYMLFSIQDGSWQKVERDVAALIEGKRALFMLKDVAVEDELKALKQGLGDRQTGTEAVQAACKKVVAQALLRHPSASLPKSSKLVGRTRKRHLVTNRSTPQRTSTEEPPTGSEQPGGSAGDERGDPSVAASPLKHKPPKRITPNDDRGLAGPSQGENLPSSKKPKMTKEALQRRKAAREGLEAAIVAASQEDAAAGAAGQAEGNMPLFPDRPVPLVHGGLAAHLKQHQVEGLQFMWRNLIDSYMKINDEDTNEEEEDPPGGVILAHTMGLGKTLTTITFLHMYFKYRNEDSSKDPLGQALLVVPANVLYNFQHELEFWLPRNRSLYGSPLDKKKVFLADGKSVHKTVRSWAEVPGSVLLISSKMFSNHVLRPDEASNGTGKKQRGRKGNAGEADLDANGDTSKGAWTDADVSRDAEGGQQQQQQPGAEADPAEAKSKQGKSCFDEETCRLLVEKPEVVAVDEAHEMRNSNTKFCRAINEVQTKRRIALTGYPLQNNLNEYYTMIHWVKPGLMGTHSDFAEEFTTVIEAGRKKGATRKEKSLMEAQLHVLEELTEAFVQVRGYDILQAELAAANVRKTEHVVLLQLSSEQESLYKCYLDAVGAEGKVLYRDMTIFRQICNTPAALEKKLRAAPKANGAEGEVDLAIEDEGGKTAKHKLSENIVDAMLQRFDAIKHGGAWTSAGERAAAAAAAATAGQPAPVFTGTAGGDAGAAVGTGTAGGGTAIAAAEAASTSGGDLWALLPKLRFLESLLRVCQSRKEKLVVFSEYTANLDSVVDMLCRPIWGDSGTAPLNEGEAFWQIRGGVASKNRASCISKFQAHKGFGVMIVSTRAGSVGINLTSASRLVILDAPWNPVHNAQAIARIHRMGQTKPTFTYWLIYKNTVEEKIYKCNIAKEELFQRVIDKKPVKKLSEDDKDYYQYATPKSMRLQGLQAELKKYGSISDTMLSGVLFGVGQDLTSSASDKELAGHRIKPLAPMIADYHLKESMLSEDKGAKLSRLMKNEATDYYVSRVQSAGSNKAAASRREKMLRKRRSQRRIEDDEDEEDADGQAAEFVRLLKEGGAPHHHHHHHHHHPHATTAHLSNINGHHHSTTATANPSNINGHHHTATTTAATSGSYIHQHTAPRPAPQAPNPHWLQLLPHQKQEDYGATHKGLDRLQQLAQPLTSNQQVLREQLLQRSRLLEAEAAQAASKQQQQLQQEQQEQQQRQQKQQQQQQEERQRQQEQQQRQQQLHPLPDKHTSSSEEAAGVGWDWYSSDARRTFFDRMRKVGAAVSPQRKQQCTDQLTLLKSQAADLERLTHRHIQHSQLPARELCSNPTGSKATGRQGGPHHSSEVRATASQSRAASAGTVLASSSAHRQRGPHHSPEAQAPACESGVASASALTSSSAQRPAHQHHEQQQPCGLPPHNVLAQECTGRERPSLGLQAQQHEQQQKDTPTDDEHRASKWQQVQHHQQQQQKDSSNTDDEHRAAKRQRQEYQRQQHTPHSVSMPASSPAGAQPPPQTPELTRAAAAPAPAAAAAASTPCTAPPAQQPSSSPSTRSAPHTVTPRPARAAREPIVPSPLIDLTQASSDEDM